MQLPGKDAHLDADGAMEDRHGAGVAIKDHVDIVPGARIDKPGRFHIIGRPFLIEGKDGLIVAVAADDAGPVAGGNLVPDRDF